MERGGGLARLFLFKRYHREIRKIFTYVRGKIYRNLTLAMKLGDRTGPEMQITVSDQLHN